MPLRYLLFRCGQCKGQLVEDVEVGEIFCCGCGLVHASIENAIPMEGVKKPLEPPVEKDKPILQRVGWDISETPKHAGGRPRSRSYMSVRTLVLKSFEKYVPPLRLKMETDVEKLLWCIVSRAFKHALFIRKEKGEFLRCKKHMAFYDGSNSAFTVDVKHPRVRVKLPCSCWVDLKMNCPFCGHQIKVSKKFFQCSNRKGPNYPGRCFCFPLKEAEEVARKEFWEYI